MAGKPGQQSALPTAMPTRYERGFTWLLDLRSRTARDMQATLAGLTNHLGGAQAISITQLYLCERLAFLERRLRDHETCVLNNQPPLLSEGEYLAAIGQLSGLCKSLGLHRTAMRVPTLAEVLDEQEDAT